MKITIPAYVGVQTVKLDISDITQSILDSDCSKTLDAFSALNALLLIVQNIPDETINNFNWALRRDFAMCLHSQAERLAGVKLEAALEQKAA